MGHAMFVTLQDAMVRYARMQGRETLWLPGTDHAGIATQLVVERDLESEGSSRQELGRELFEERVWEWKRRCGGSICGQLRVLGASCDWSRERFTLDEGLSAAVREAFVRLSDDGLVYRGSYLVNWSPRLRTAVSDLEVEYSEEKGTLFYFRYPVATVENADDGSFSLSPTWLDDGDFLPVATTRPETIPGDAAVAVHPQDPRFARFVGKRAVVPLFSGGEGVGVGVGVGVGSSSVGDAKSLPLPLRTIPIVGDEAVDREFGTGALKITPGHDPVDYEVGQRLGLETINIMSDDGTLNAGAGAGLSGLDRFVARAKVWEALQVSGLAIKEEPHLSRVPRSQRGGEIVEPLVREQWFVRMKPLAEPALAAVRGATPETRLVPQRFTSVYERWLSEIRDWCVSRQLWWGHRIPVWYVFASEGEAEASADGRSGRWVAARSEAEARERVEEENKSSSAASSSSSTSSFALRQETDVLDTWFSSALWPFSTLGWPNEGAEDLRRFYPTSTLETGHDILFFWVARMMMMGIRLTGRAPFDTVFLHGLVRDAEGRKMSKSLGNVVDPVDVVASVGADALRFTLATGTTPGQDLNLNPERLTSSRNLTNKLWNAGKFVLMALQDKETKELRRPPKNYSEIVDFATASASSLSSLPLTDRWILGSFHQAVARVTAAYDRLDYGDAGRGFAEFFWGDFTDWYVEAAKVRLNPQPTTSAADAADAAATAEAEAETTRAVLLYVFEGVLALAHPVMPFVTEKLWRALPKEEEEEEGRSKRSDDLISGSWPVAGAVDETAMAHFSAAKELVTAVRNARADYGVELGRKVPAELQVADVECREALRKELAVVASLAKLDLAASGVTGMPDSSVSSSSDSSSSSSGTVTAVVRDGLQAALPMAGLFDAAKELARLDKQRVKAAAAAEKASARLSDPKFKSNAPPAVVAKATEEAEGLSARVAAIDAKIEEVRKLA